MGSITGAQNVMELADFWSRIVSAADFIVLGGIFNGYTSGATYLHSLSCFICLSLKRTWR